MALRRSSDYAVVKDSDDSRFFILTFASLKSDAKVIKINSKVFYTQPRSKIEAQGAIEFVGSKRDCDDFLRSKCNSSIPATTDRAPVEIRKAYSKNTLVEKNLALESSLTDLKIKNDNLVLKNKEFLEENEKLRIENDNLKIENDKIQIELNDFINEESLKVEPSTNNSASELEKIFNILQCILSTVSLSK
jgi:regulator of replication initiation timing